MSDKNDDKIDDELQFEKDLQSALGKESRQLMKDKLVQLDQKIVARQSMNKFFIIIGILLLLFMASLIVWNNMQSNSNEFNTKTTEEVFAMRFEPYPNIVAPIVKGDNDVTDREKAFQLYEQGNYAAALPLLNELTFAKNDTVAMFYHANILLKNGDTKQAINQFKTIIKSKNQTFVQPAEWYLTLAFVKNNQIEETRKFAYDNIISNDNHPHEKDAITLMRYLEFQLKKK